MGTHESHLFRYEHFMLIPFSVWQKPCSINVLFLPILKIVYLKISAYWIINILGIAEVGYDWKVETLVDSMSPFEFMYDYVSPQSSHVIF